MLTFVLDGEALKFHSFYHRSAVITSYNTSVLDYASLKLLCKFLIMSICVPVWGMYTGECGHPWQQRVEEAMRFFEQPDTGAENQRSFPTEVLSFNCEQNHRPGAQVMY